MLLAALSVLIPESHNVIVLSKVIVEIFPSSSQNTPDSNRVESKFFAYIWGGVYPSQLMASQSPDQWPVTIPRAPWYPAAVPWTQAALQRLQGLQRQGLEPWLEQECGPGGVYGRSQRGFCYGIVGTYPAVGVGLSKV